MVDRLPLRRSQDVARCGARIDQLQCALRGARCLLRAVPLRLLALQNCRSINLFGLDLPSSLRALLLCGVNGEPARALAAPHVVEAMRGLRVLGLHDCECPAPDLMRLPRLPALAALLVGGDGILNEPRRRRGAATSSRRHGRPLGGRGRQRAGASAPGGDRGDARLR